MRLHVNGHVEIAGHAAPAARVPRRRNAHLHAVADAGGHVNPDGLAADRSSLAGAHRTELGGLSPRAAARRTRLREHHVAPRPANLPDALTGAALSPGRRHVPVARAGAAHHVPRHDHLPLDAAHRRRERQRQRGVQIGPGLGAPAAGRPRRMKHVREKLRERGRLRPVPRHRKIELREHERRAVRSRPGRPLPLVVVPLPAARIDERFVRLRDALEHLLRRAITRIHSRVIAAREPPVRPLDVRGAGVRRHAEEDVKLHGWFSGSRFRPGFQVRALEP